MIARRETKGRDLRKYDDHYDDDTAVSEISADDADQALSPVARRLFGTNVSVCHRRLRSSQTDFRIYIRRPNDGA